MSDSLRNKIIRLAHSNPELRDQLLPLLRKEGASSASKVLQEVAKHFERKGFTTQLSRHDVTKEPDATLSIWHDSDDPDSDQTFSVWVDSDSNEWGVGTVGSKQRPGISERDFDGFPDWREVLQALYRIDKHRYLSAKK